MSYPVLSQLHWDDGISHTRDGTKTGGVPSISAVCWTGDYKPTFKVGDTFNAHVRLKSAEGGATVRGYSLKVAHLVDMGELFSVRLVGPYGSVRV